MTAIAKMLTLALPASSAETEVLKTLGIFCGVSLLMALCVASYGVDLSPGFF
jgi:hypothetical protein